ncbi:MAG TPA: bifunctional 4-hydroxy-2-oxoglutarate aldolase/2-dehydro-3-deoxy-phosphogluconate aldolase [Labilithrix sp.]|nr:bifunctional 4-hydroxy-2-oxoglutarate aldolase/2-dehydro-3-deoxy-phosphogluconate aldolase [Labilithrix sp.]
MQEIAHHRVLGVLRFDDATRLAHVVEALAEGEIYVVEVTLTMPNALEAMSGLISRLDDRVILGAGSVLDSETARLAILAGARFVVSPTFCRGVIEVCHRYDVAAIPGAYTPTEIANAWEAGADLVKVFPAGALGPGYVKAVRGPLPHVRLVPTGGVRLDNAVDFLGAGAVAVGMGDALIDPKAVARGEYAQIATQARRLVASLRAAREERK